MLTTDQGILIGVSGLLIGLSIGLGFSAHHKKNQPRQISFQSQRQSKEASREMREKLIVMVGGDRQEAQRLVARARFCRYGKSEAYYWWRAIQTLEQKRQHRKSL